MTTLALVVLLASQKDKADVPKPAAPQEDSIAQTEMQPLFGAQLPKYYQWRPLTNRQRWEVFWKQDFLSTAALIRPLTPALLLQAAREPEEWPRTLGGLSSRYGSNWMAATTQDLVETGAASIWKQDTRYIACRCDKPMARLWNAVRQSAFTYNDEGRWVFAGPRALGNFAASAVTVYGLYPRAHRNTQEFVMTGLSQFYYNALGNIVREFLGGRKGRKGKRNADSVSHGSEQGRR